MKKANWLFGDGAIEKISKVNSVFKAKKIKEASSYFKYNIAEYKPFLASFDNYKNYSLEELQSILFRRNTNSDFELLIAKNDLYKRMPSLTALNRFGNDFSLYTKKSDFENGFTSEYREAIELIEGSCYWLSSMFKEVIVEVCAVKFRDQYRIEFGCSDYRLIGSILTSLKPHPFSTLNLSISIVHELAHNVFMLYQAGQDPIKEDFQNTTALSGLRRVQRPIYGTIHAAVALSYMIKFLEGFSNSKTHSDSERVEADRLLIDYLNSLKIGLSEINDDRLNQIGVVVLKEIRSLL